MQHTRNRDRVLALELAAFLAVIYQVIKGKIGNHVTTTRHKMYLAVGVRGIEQVYLGQRFDGCERGISGRYRQAIHRPFQTLNIDAIKRQAGAEADLGNHLGHRPTCR